MAYEGTAEAWIVGAVRTPIGNAAALELRAP